MARRGAARGRGRGGDGIQAARPARAGVAAGALAVGTALAAYPALAADRLGWPLAATGVLGLLVLAWGALGSAAALPWALLLFGGAYAGSLFLPDDGPDPAAPVVAAGLIAVAELAYWAQELRAPTADEPGIVARRVLVVTGVAAAALVAAALVFTATALPLSGGLAWDAVGVGAAVAAFLLVARLARRPER
jgi:hypothetical protein